MDNASVPSESLALFFSVLLGIFHIGLQSLSMTAQLGVDYNVGNREQLVPLHGAAARLERASKNFQETFPLFACATLLVIVLQQSSALTQAGAWLYLGARVIYLGVFWTGVRYVRTFVWGVSLVGLICVLSGALVR